MQLRQGWKRCSGILAGSWISLGDAAFAQAFPAFRSTSREHRRCAGHSARGSFAGGFPPRGGHRIGPCCSQAAWPHRLFVCCLYLSVHLNWIAHRSYSSSGSRYPVASQSFSLRVSAGEAGWEGAGGKDRGGDQEHGWHPALRTQPPSSWLWRGPRVPKGELRVQSGCAGPDPEHVGISWGFCWCPCLWVWLLVCVTNSYHWNFFFFFPPPTYTSMFSHPASGSVETGARKRSLSGIYNRCALEISSVFATVLRGPGNQTLLKCLERYGWACSPWLHAIEDTSKCSAVLKHSGF